MSDSQGDHREDCRHLTTKYSPTHSTCCRSCQWLPAEMFRVAVPSNFLRAAETPKGDAFWLRIFFLPVTTFSEAKDRDLTAATASSSNFQMWASVPPKNCWILGFLGHLGCSVHLSELTFLHRVLAKSSSLVLCNSLKKAVQRPLKFWSRNKSEKYCS